MDKGSDGAGWTQGFDYFVVRMSRSDREPRRLSGLIERLGSGEKRWFDTSDQLVRLVTLWPEPIPRASTEETTS